jgi:DNA-directed RNA polymerase subunit RPC12/RpoP
MDIDFNCPRCNQPLSVEASGAGMLVNCPDCNEQIEVPRATAPRGAKRGEIGVEGNPKLMPCPDCGREVSKTAANCPHCGRELNFGQQVAMGAALGLLAVIIIGLLLIGCLLLWNGF